MSWRQFESSSVHAAEEDVIVLDSSDDEDKEPAKKASSSAGPVNGMSPSTSGTSSLSGPGAAAQDCGSFDFLPPAMLEAAQKAVAAHVKQFQMAEKRRSAGKEEDEDEDIQVEYQKVRPVKTHTVQVVLDRNLHGQVLAALKERGVMSEQADVSSLKLSPDALGPASKLLSNMSLRLNIHQDENGAKGKNRSSTSTSGSKQGLREGEGSINGISRNAPFTPPAGGIKRLRELSPPESATPLNSVQPLVPSASGAGRGKADEDLVRSKKRRVEDTSSATSSTSCKDSSQDSSISRANSDRRSARMSFNNKSDRPREKTQRRKTLPPSSGGQSLLLRGHHDRSLRKSTDTAKTDNHAKGGSTEPSSSFGAGAKTDSLIQATSTEASAFDSSYQDPTASGSPSSRLSKRPRSRRMAKKSRRPRQEILAANLPAQRDFLLRHLGVRVLDGDPFVSVSLFRRMFSDFVPDLNQVCEAIASFPSGQRRLSRHTRFEGWTLSLVSPHVAREMLRVRLRRLRQEGGRREEGNGGAALTPPPEVIFRCLSQFSSHNAPEVVVEDFDRKDQEVAPSHPPQSTKDPHIRNGYSQKSAVKDDDLELPPPPLLPDMPGLGPATLSSSSRTSNSRKSTEGSILPISGRKMPKLKVILPRLDVSAVRSPGKLTPLFRTDRRRARPSSFPPPPSPPAASAASADDNSSLRGDPGRDGGDGAHQTLSMEKKGISLPPGWHITTLQPPPMSKYKYISPCGKVFRSLEKAFEFSQSKECGGAVSRPQNVAGNESPSGNAPLPAKRPPGRPKKHPPPPPPQILTKPEPQKKKANEEKGLSLQEIVDRKKRSCRKYASILVSRRAGGCVPGDDGQAPKRRRKKKVHLSRGPPRPTLPGTLSLAGLRVKTGCSGHGWFADKIELLRSLSEPRKREKVSASASSFQRNRHHLKTRANSGLESVRVRFDAEEFVILDLADKLNGIADGITEEELHRAAPRGRRGPRVPSEEEVQPIETPREVAQRIQETTSGKASQSGAWWWRGKMTLEQQRTPDPVVAKVVEASYSSRSQYVVSKSGAKILRGGGAWAATAAATLQEFGQDKLRELFPEEEEGE